MWEEIRNIRSTYARTYGRKEDIENCMGYLDLAKRNKLCHWGSLVYDEAPGVPYLILHIAIGMGN